MMWLNEEDKGPEKLSRIKKKELELDFEEWKSLSWV